MVFTHFLRIKNKGRKNPAFVFDAVTLVGADDTGYQSAMNYMCSIITSPKPEHDTWVAPGIRRAKS